MTEATLTATRTKLLWLGSWPPPPNVVQAAGDRWEMTGADPGRPLGDQLTQAPVAVVALDDRDDGRALAGLLDRLARSATVAVLLLADDAPTARAMLQGRRGQFLCVAADAPAEELAAKLSAAADLQPAIAALRKELSTAPSTDGAARADLAELDEQLRLAGRLQQDFLPRRMPEVGPLRFAALYHPAGWVSGDLYDVSRLDETHVGFYIADAVGHGMPAALLTMFIKKALQTKRIFGHAYRIVPPDASLAELNADICDQNLPSCQFCTAVYGVVDVSTLTLTFARAGHPEPILIRADGSPVRLSSPGGLLGVLPDATFPLHHVRLAPGDRLVLYTDGLEGLLGRFGDGRRPDATATFAAWAKLPRQEILLRLTERLECAPPDLRSEDDVTVLIMDVERG
ncbi:MAG: PP2C family protein-serine/threonine phosphatase [Phycisphaerae bacterium]|nr:PP2C family protein-serine/threonine phosphatase [Phycisphaerae bacterium]